MKDRFGQRRQREKTTATKTEDRFCWRRRTMKDRLSWRTEGKKDSLDTGEEK